MLQRQIPKENNTSWRTNKNNNPGVCLSGDKSEAEQQIAESNPAQSYGSSHDLEARCGKPCSSITNGYSIAESENNLPRAAAQLNNSCETGISLMNSHDNATVNNVSADTKFLTYYRRSHLKSLESCSRKRRKGTLESYSRQRRKGSDLSVMNSLPIQDVIQNGTEDTFLDQSIEEPSLSSSKSMCQNEVTAGDGASLIIMDDMTLEKALDGCSDCEHAAGNSLKVNTGKVSSDDAIDIQEENLEMAQSTQPKDVRDKACDVLVAEENLSKSTCSKENKAPYDVPMWGTSNAEVAQKRQDATGKSTPSSLQTNVLNEVITQFKNEDMKSSLTRAPTGSSRRKLLVLDVNGLLADIVPVAYVSDRYIPDATISGKAVFKRPFCDEFLEFCFRRFNVGVWSSRTKRNVNSVVDFLMGKVRDNLLFCWDQSHCTGTGYNTVENSSKPLVLKELRKLWEKSEQDLPWKIGEYDKSNTLLLDDSPYKALCNPSNTAIFPHTYQYRDEKDNSLGPGGDLYVYLEGLAEAADVQTYVKQNPFGQQPITEENASWDFYLKVKESSTSIPSQSPKSSVKSENVVSQGDLTSSAAGKLEEFADSGCKNLEFTTAGSSHEVLQVTNALRDVEGDSVSGSIKQEDLKRTSGMLEVDELGRLVRQKTTVCDSGDSPSCIWRCSKRGRSGSRSRSPIRGRSRSRSRYPCDRRSLWGGRERHGRSRSLSHERCRSRSKSPLYRRGGEFGGDKTRRDKAPLEECRAFIRGKCYRGASCWYLHHECDPTDRSRSHWWKQQYQDVPRSSKSSDIDVGTEIIPPERSVHEHSGCKTQVLDQDILVMEERKGMKEQLCKYTTQLCDKMRRDKAPLQECRDFMRGKCYRGASCWYLHHESDTTGRSRSHWCKQQYQDVPPSSKSSDIHGETETIPPERSVHEHSGCKTQVLDQDILVLEERKGMKEQLCKFTTQLCDKMRRDEAPLEECRAFMRGKCYRGASCWYLHHESGPTDRSRSHWCKQQYQDVPPSSKSSDIHGETETIPPERSVHEHSGCKTKVLDQDILVLEERKGMKEELYKFTTQLCNKMRRDEAPLEECRAFMRGKCYRGASCWYLHHESGPTDRSRSHWWKQQYQDVPPSSKSADIHGETETIPPERSVHEHSGCKTQVLDQDILVLEERKGMKEDLYKFTTQLCNKMRRDEASLEECRAFMRGKCYRGASCWYLHHESGPTDRSRSHWWKQQYQDVPPSSKSADIYGETETIPPERSVHEHSGCKTQVLDQDILVMEESKGMKEELCKSTTQLCDKMRRAKAPLQECRDFMRGKCYRGAYCRYLHHESDKTDRSRAYRSKQQQHQDVPFSSKSSETCGEVASIPRERSVHEHNELKTQDSKQLFPAMEEGKVMKEELGKSTTQLCDKECHLEPSVLPLADAENEKAPDDVAHCLPAPVEISVIEQTEVHYSDGVVQNANHQPQ